MYCSRKKNALHKQGGKKIIMFVNNKPVLTVLDPSIFTNKKAVFVITLPNGHILRVDYTHHA